MPNYTGQADQDGKFDISFGGDEYTSGEKITVTATKDAASKTIEIFAPSEPIPPAISGAIKFSGNFFEFPKNVGVITFSSDISGVIQSNALGATTVTNWNIFRMATGCVFEGNVTQFDSSSMSNWSNVLNFTAPRSLENMGLSAFSGWTACRWFDFGDKLISIGATCFANCSNCDYFIFRSVVPPTILSSAFNNVKSTFVIKVPAESVDAYKTAPNWSTFASRIQAI